VSSEPNAVESAASDQRVIDDVDTLKVVADPLRLQILLEAIDRPVTVKELAATLGVPQTRLYYHVKLLEKHGLISVVGRRMVSGIEERSYRSPANGWTISRDLLADAVAAGLLTALFDLTRAEIEVSLANSSAAPGEPDSDVPLLTFNRTWLSEEEVAEIQEAMRAIFDRYPLSEPGPGKTEYKGVYAMYRAPQPAEERADDAP
jgi:DNA-binding transcriptional ArsR family regulator